MINTVLIVCFLALLWYYKKHSATKTIPISAFNSKQYIVNNLDGKHEVAKKIAMIDEMIIRLIAIDDTESPPGMDTFITRLRERYTNTVLRENESLSPESNMTSYSVNKGEQIVLCVRNPSNPFTFIDDNTLKYVAIHEISHIACPENGHTPLFREIYLYLIRLAIKQRMYIYENYSANPKNYCGIVIRQSVFDS